MKSLFILFASFFLILSAGASEKDSFAGHYEGRVDGCRQYPLNSFPEVWAELSRGTDSYTLKLTSNAFSRSESHFVIKGLKAENGSIPLRDAGEWKLNGSITPDSIEAEGSAYGKNPVKISLKRSDFTSPTMGARPPEGAVLLFDGKDLSEWEFSDGSPCTWIIENSATVASPADRDNPKRKSDAISKRSFGALKAHVEFKIPAEYNKSGFRGNSGVYFGPYEIQVLDSFGSDGTWLDCGSIYRIHPPKVNASLEPEAWQTYDIEFTPAKFDGDKMTDYPRMSVWQNGVKIQSDEPVYYDTHLSPAKGKGFVHPRGDLKISLQFHGDPVAYRNIWVEEIR